jgi:hypothetical protein
VVFWFFVILAVWGAALVVTFGVKFRQALRGSGGVSTGVHL